MSVRCRHDSSRCARFHAMIFSMVDWDCLAGLPAGFSSPDITGPDWYDAMSRVTGTIPNVRCGRPEPHFVRTSHLERLNLTVRMQLRRYARRTNAHSRKLGNHKAFFALWVAWYNFVSVNTAVRMTPAMTSGLTSTIWTMRNLLLGE
jgi:hypothetical protein